MLRRWRASWVAGLLLAAPPAHADWLSPQTTPPAPSSPIAAVRYVADPPGQNAARVQLGELLWRRDQWPEARAQFEQFLAHAGPADAGRLLHCHSRLMAIAARAGDAYGEHLHRGIALWLLATQPGGDEQESEGLLCKAAGELTLAARERPDEARPHWYLARVWSRLGQSQPAAANLRRARELAPFAVLTAAERRELASELATDEYR
jgi:tetratricopeptide (TPR) repeat protein